MAQDLILASIQQAVPAEPYLALNPVAYFNAKYIEQADDSPVTQWNDLSGNDYHLFDGPASPLFTSVGGNRVIFSGASNVEMEMASNHAALDFDPDGSNYTIIMEFGSEALVSFSSYVLLKGSTATGSRQFSLSTNSSGNNMTMRIGDTNGNVNLSGYRSLLPNSYLVIRRDGGDYFIYRNDVEFTNKTPGPDMSTGVWQVGGRNNGSDLNLEFSLKKLVFFDYAVPLATLTERYNNRNDE